MGDYLVREEDLPLYAVEIEDCGRLRIRRLEAGFRNGTNQWRVLENRRPSS
jgi:hypothetical protein